MSEHDPLAPQEGTPEEHSAKNADDTSASATTSSDAYEQTSIEPRSRMVYYFGALAALILLIVALWMSGFFPERSQTVTELEVFQVVGILPQTGDAASFGVPIKQAAQLAQKEINEMGGIDGKLVVIEWRDGKCEAEDARAAAGQLLAQYEPDFIIAGSCSSEALSAVPLADQAGIVSFSPSATSPELTGISPLFFRSSPSDALAGEVAAQYAYEDLGARTVAIISEDKAYTQGLREVFSRQFTKRGGEVLIDVVYEPPGGATFDSFAAEVAAANVDVVYILPQSPTPGILAVQALKRAGVTASLLTAEVLLIRDALVEQGDVLEGVTGIEVYFDESRPAAAQLLAAFEDEYNLEATYPGFMAGMYDMMYLIKEAHENTDGSAQSVRSYLMNVQYEGAVGTLSFDESGDPNATYSVRTVVDQEAPVQEVIERARF